MRIQRIYVNNNEANDQDKFVITNELDEIIAKYKGKKGSIIPLLQGVQAVFGFLPRAAFEKIAKETGLELSDMYGVATFYTQFRLNPVGKHIIKVCHGTACHVQNANAVSEALAEELKIKDGETTPDGLFTLESVACLGCCSLAPVMMIDNDTYGKLNNKSALKVLREIAKKEKQ